MSTGVKNNKYIRSNKSSNPNINNNSNNNINEREEQKANSIGWTMLQDPQAY